MQSGWVDVLLSNKVLLQKVFDQFCNTVQREEFTKSLVALGLIDPSQQECATQHSESAESECSPIAQAASSAANMPEVKVRWHVRYTVMYSQNLFKNCHLIIFFVQLNLMQSVCISPSSRKSSLSKGALPLLQFGKNYDMVFEVLATKGKISL